MPQLVRVCARLRVSAAVRKCRWREVSKVPIVGSVESADRKRCLNCRWWEVSKLPIVRGV
eukprot:975407-Pleurochrysis_carterae.AAC.1